MYDRRTVVLNSQSLRTPRYVVAKRRTKTRALGELLENELPP